MIYTSLKERGALPQVARLSIAALASLWVASAVGIQSAYWAAMPVWVITQATREITLARALYRIMGTLCGAMIAIAFLLLFPNGGLTLVAATAGTLTVLATACQVVTGVRVYALLMTAITIAVVVIPSLSQQHPNLYMAVERVACTLIGVTVSTLVMCPFLPSLDRQADRRALTQARTEVSAAARRALSGRVFDVGIVARSLRTVNAVALRASDSYEASRHARRTYNQAVAVRNHVVELAALIRLVSEAGRGADLSPALVQSAAPDGSGLPGLNAIVAKIRDLLEAHRTEDVPRADRHSWASQIRALPNRPISRQRATQALLRSTLFVGPALLLCWLIPSQASAAFALCVSIFALVLGSVPDARAAAPKLIVGVICGVLAALIYRLVTVEVPQETWALVVSAAPFLTIAAVARTYKATSGPALDAAMCFLLASQLGIPAPPLSSSALIAASMIAGTAAIAVAFFLAQPSSQRAIGLAHGALYWLPDSKPALWQAIGDVARALPPDNAAVARLDMAPVHRRSLSLATDVLSAAGQSPSPANGRVDLTEARETQSWLLGVQRVMLFDRLALYPPIAGGR